MTKWSMTYLTMTIMFVLASCGGSEEQVTTDMIHFPSSASGTENEQALPQLTFDEDEFDFGKIAAGEKVRHAFQFENTGQSPLLISKVESSCGCTVMKDWPKEPLAPGEGGQIIVEFDSSKRSGQQRKKITVLANTVPSKNILYIGGEVLGPQSTIE